MLHRCGLKRHMLLHSLLVFGVATFSACSGGGASMSTSPPAISGASLPGTIYSVPYVASQAPVPVTLRYIMAPSVTTSSVASHTLTTQSVRRLQTASGYTGYTSTATQPVSMSLNITPLGGSTTNVTSTSCAAPSGGGTSGSCTITFSAAPGPTTLAGTLSAGAGVIASFSQVSIIQPNTVNTLNFTANPVVNSVVLQLSAPKTYLGNPAVNAGSPANVALTVNAEDANGNTIAGTAQYVDSNGNPVSFLLNVTNTQAGGKGTVTILGPARITAPSQAAIYAHYDGNWLQSSTISVTSTSSAVTSLTPVILATMPHITEYTAAGGPTGITSGADGNIWFVEHSTNKVIKMAVSGAVLGTYTCAACNDGPYDITAGFDGNLWFTDSNASLINKISTSGAITSYPVTPIGNPVSIVAAPDGNIWYAERLTTAVVKTGIAGNQNHYSTGGGNVFGIGVGPDNNIWCLNFGSSAIVKIGLNGQILASYPVAGLADFSDGVVAGPDGNVWFVNYGTSAVEKTTVNGSITSYPLQAGAQPSHITIGPDNNIWFTESGAGKSSIGQITTNGTLQEFGTAYGISNASSTPEGITLGPDGNLWFTEYAKNIVAKFVL